MIFKLLTLLLLYLNPKKHNSNTGFALFMVMVLGTIGTVTTAAMLTRTNHLRSNVATSTLAYQNFSIAETAAVNIKALLIEHNQLLEYDLDAWEEYLKSPNSSEKSREFNHNLRLCTKQRDWKEKKQKILDLAQHNMIDAPMGKFSLLDFQKVDNDKILATIQTQNSQQDYAQYEIDISFSDNYVTKPVPVLWLTGNKQTDELGNAQVNGNIWANDCGFQIKKVNLMEGDENQPKYTGIKLPDLSNLEGIKDRLPENNYFPSMIGEEEEQEDQTEEELSLELPRAEDKPTRKEDNKKVYEYLINNVEVIDSLIINSDFQGKSKIILYIVGDINISEIVHKCQSSTHCSPENLIIVAYEGSQMCLQFDTLDAFIVAPDHEVGMKTKNDSGESAKFTGSIWTDKLLTTGDCGNDEIEFHEGLKWGDLSNEFQALNTTSKLIQVNLREEEVENNEG